jgi:hypothetical protein
VIKLKVRGVGDYRKLWRVVTAVVNDLQDIKWMLPAILSESTSTERPVATELMCFGDILPSAPCPIDPVFSAMSSGSAKKRQEKVELA